MKSKTLHESLRLPSQYQVKTSMTGHVRVGKGYNESKLIELRHLRTDATGQNEVHAIKVVHGDGEWHEINSGQFSVLAMSVITGHQMEIKNVEVWGEK